MQAAGSELLVSEENEAQESPQMHNEVPTDPSPPTMDVSIRGRGRGRGRVGEMGPPISSSLGAMGPLIWKLDKLLQLRSLPQGCPSDRVQKGICDLKDDVENLSSCLQDLAELEDPPAMVKCWMNEARDLSYRMDDYINSLIFVQPTEDPCPVARDIKITRFRHKWFSRVRTPKKLTRDDQIEGTVSEFRMYVRGAMERHKVYNLKNFSSGRVVSVGRMPPMSYEETSDIVISGRMNEFINSLVADNGANQLQLKVVSIHGSSCLGKTTLARLMYTKFSKQYDCRAFVRVSKKPDMKKIFRHMLSELQRHDPPPYCNEIDIVRSIERYLEGKRYLVIIDDLWDTSVWDIINRAFPKGSHGSRIITTTQIEDIAFRCCCYQSENVFEMKPLDDHHSKKLFFKVFVPENSIPEPLKEVFNKIVQICGGLPLAIISIASLLASQPNITEGILKHIHESLSSCFSASSTSERTRQALNLSFKNLPHHLKTCLLYFSIYPEGNIFWRHDLVKQWMAESFIHGTEGQDMEEVARSYLDELVARRFIQPICVNYNNEALSFAVHDTVHDLVSHKSAEENFIVAIDESPTDVLLSHKARRLSLLFGDARYAKIPANIGKSHVRSLTYSGFFECMPTITEFKLLRILNLQLSSHGRDEDPVDFTGISELDQLRYLKIASDVSIILPDHWVQGLETLDIMDARLVCVPSDIRLSHLLHLSLPIDGSLSIWMFYKLNYLQDLHLTTSSHFSHLEECMEALGSLINGHCNLKTIVVAYGPMGEKNVVRGSSNVTISWEFVVPPHFLQRFEFLPHNMCIFYRIPKWIKELDYLSVLKISVEELQSGCVDILRGLPALTVLSLYVLKGSHTAPYNKFSFYRVGGFSVLKYFKLKFASGIAWIEFKADAMPKLWNLKLVFNSIPRMDKEVHGTISIEHMPSLIEISVKFGGGAAGREAMFVNNNAKNPRINEQSMVCSSFGDESRKLKQRPYEILQEERGKYDKKSKSQADQRSSRLVKSFPRQHVPDVSSRGRGKVGEMGPPVSASLGATGPLVWKLDKLLRAAPPGCSSNRVQEGMRNLKEQVEELSACLYDLSEVEDPPPTAKFWMNEARDLSYKMEDYIDNLLFAHNINTTIPFRFERDEQIVARVSEFSKYAQEAIQARPEVGRTTTLRRRFVSLGPAIPVPAPYEDIVIDGRMSEFIDSLANDEGQELKVVSILGSACLGKTTLAKVLYTKLRNQYNCRVFVQVSKKPDMKSIFRDILSQLQRHDPPDYRSEIDLSHKITKYLKYKRYFIFIDDIRDASVWYNISHAFPKGSQGSRILITTRIKEVALICCSYQPELVFEMKPLDNDHSRKLFFNILFGSESGCPEILKDISNKIIEACGGLPLSTISIASLLASQPVITEDLLKHIHESLSSCLSASSTLEEKTREALNLSFENLPRYLKTCLLYLGMCPEGYRYCNEDLVKQWMAEGFIHTTQGQDAEKVAESYLHQLIGRRFIQRIHINYNNNVLSCAVHDTVHDLIAHKSAEENFFVATYYNENNVALSHKARRVSLLCGDAKYTKTLANITKSQVRSLSFFGLFECMPCITEYKLLRALNLQVSRHGGEDNPVDLSGISELIHLRYLKIGCGLYIKLQLDIGLECLETLDIRDAVLTDTLLMPRSHSLLHVALPFESSLSSGVLGERVQDLHLTSSSTRTSDLERDMRAMDTLISGHVNLRTVVVVAHGTKTKNTVVSGAPLTTSLDDLVPPPLLQRFECSPGSGITFTRTPKWARELHSLCILNITVKKLEMDCIRILCGLRALTTLSLYVCWQNTERIIFDRKGFLALKYFKLRYMDGIAWIKFEADAMPDLLRLRLVFNAIPRIHPFFRWTHNGRSEQYKRGNPLIFIEHMPSLREISAKFGGAAADLKHIMGTGISNDPSNPTIVTQLVDSGSCGNQQDEEDPAYKTLYKADPERLLESLHVFTLDELMSSTNNFSKVHFHGDNNTENNLDKTFCRPGVYKGSFEHNLGRQKVVVKCVNKFSDGREWLLVDRSELKCLATVRHPHLVKLLGFCDYYEHMMLVYEDMPNRSFEQLLSENLRSRGSKLQALLSRLKIAVGVAKGLAFLHEADKPMVLGDFQGSHVILLDSELSPKLFGFCLAKESARDKTAERDVYNFGVLLLHLLIAKPLDEDSYFDQPEEVLTDSLYGSGGPHKVLAILDHPDKLQWSVSAAWNAVTFAGRCVERVPEKRPSMREALEVLEALLQVADDDDKPREDIQAGSTLSTH